MVEKRDMISSSEALRHMLQSVKTIDEVELVDLWACSGRILAGDAMAPFAQPPFRQAKADGYACRAADLAEATSDSPRQLRVIAEVDAGDCFSGEVRSGEAVRIMTGAAVPAGCDCCVRQELTDYGEDFVMIDTAVEAGGDICPIGAQFQVGQCLAEAGRKLRHKEIGLLASIGLSQVNVLRLPKIAILTTGDELVMPGSALTEGKIYNSNMATLASRLEELGVTPTWMRAVGDDAATVAAAIAEAVGQCDLVITTGGVCVGKKDILHEALPMLGAERKFWGVDVRPGGAMMFSLYQGKPIVSLTGKPGGAFACFELFVRPMIAKLCGDRAPIPFVISGVKNSGKTTMVTKLLPLLVAKGLRVATVKHDGHDFDADVPGTDTYRHFHAGAYGTSIYSGTKYAVVKRQEGLTEDDVALFFPKADLLIYEGFKWTPYPKIELVRAGNSARPVCDPGTIVALATNVPEEARVGWDEIQAPIYDINDAEGLAEVIYEYWKEMRR